MAKKWIVTVECTTTESVVFNQGYENKTQAVEEYLKQKGFEGLGYKVYLS